MYKKHFKRFLDLMASILDFALKWPLFLCLSLLVRIRLGRPILFRKVRFGLPLIVSPAQSEVGRFVVKAGCGAVVKGPSPRELALAIGALLSDVERQKEMARASRRLFEATFRAADVYGAMAAHLETIARPK